MNSARIPHPRLRSFPAAQFVLALVSAAVAFSVSSRAQTIDFFRVDDPEIPLGGAAFVEWQVSDADVVSITGLGTVAAAGSALVSPPTLTLIPRGSAWLYEDSGSDLGPSDQPPSAGAWFHPAYDDIDWRVGAAPLGYGDAPATEIRFGPDDDNAFNDPDAKNVTYYFRHRFVLDAATVAAIDALFIELQRDDGAIVYVNGTEVFRTNLPAGSVTADTLAVRAIGGGEEGAFFRHVVSPALLTEGENWVAVEIHQAAPTSSDLRFDLSLTASSLLPDPVVLTLNAQGADTLPLLDFGSTWHYLADGTDQLSGPTPFHAPSFDPVAAGWPSGEGDFGYSHANERTVLDPGPDPDNKPITYYFRRRFELPSGLAGTISTVDLGVRADDAAIVYLNGAEVFRSANLPAGPVAFDTPATSATADEINFTTVTLGPLVTSQLRDGTNVVAVEIHNASAASSDISFDLFLRGGGRTMIPPGDDWKFDDAGEDRGPSDQPPAGAWFGTGFNDGSWPEGPAELGFGDGDPATVTTTVIPYGDPANKAITYYFRRDFNLTAGQLQGVDTVAINLLRDDGAVVYLNGVEVVRDNVPDPADFITPAASNSQAQVAHLVDASRFVVGRNVLAVELHQAGPTSSDILFDLQVSEVVSRELTVTTVDLPPAEPPYLTTSNGADLHWNMGEIWLDNSPPTPDRDYIVYGNVDRTVRPGDGTDLFFNGATLALRGPRARLLLDQAAGEDAVADVRLEGGRIEAGAGSLRSFDGTVEAVATSTFSPAAPGRGLEVAASVSGSADIVVEGGFADGYVVLSGSNGGFSGDWLVDGTLRPADSESLGDGAVIVRAGGAFDPLVNLVALDAEVDVPAGGGVFVLRGDHGFGRLVVNGGALPAGRYDFAALQARGLGGFFEDRGGSVTIGANPDTDGDGLPDAWELANFGALSARAGEDPDRDGRNNLEEYEDGTDPGDAGSVFRVIAIEKPVATPAVTVTWLSSPRNDYRILFSDDGIAWQAVTALVAGGDGSQSWTDDGSETGAPPGVQPTRFYAIERVDPLN